MKQFYNFLVERTSDRRNASPRAIFINFQGLVTVLILTLVMGFGYAGIGQKSIVKVNSVQPQTESGYQISVKSSDGVAIGLQTPEKLMDLNGIGESANPPRKAPLVTNTFTGTGNWGTTARWSQGHVPLNTEDAVIAGTCTVASAGVCLSLTVNSGYTMTINSTRSVTVGTGGLTNNGTITLTAGTSTTYTYLYDAGNFTNSNTGIYTATGTYTTLYFNGTTPQSFTNNGTVTAPMYVMTLANSTGLTLLGANQIPVTRVNLFYGTISNSNKITLGNGGATYGVVQIGTSTSYAAGSFDQAPTFNYGTGGIQLLYAPASANYSTSYEVPPDGNVAYFYLVCTPRTVSMTRDITVPYIYSTGLNLASGTLSIGSHTLTVDGTVAATSGTLLGGTSSNITFSGTAGSTILPAVSGGLNNLTINRSGGISMTGACTVNGTLTLTKGYLSNGSYLTMANGSTISRSAGQLASAPTFAGTVNLTYTGSNAVSTAKELPSGPGVLNNLTTNSGGTVQRNNYTETVLTNYYTQGFNSSTIPADWSTVVINDQGTFASPAITFITSGTNPTASPSEGTNFVKFNSYDCDAGDQILLYQNTPLNMTGKIKVTVVFDWYLSATYTNSDNVQVLWSTDGVNFNSGPVYSRYNATAAWTTLSILLPPEAENQSSIYLGLLFTSAYGLNCYVDNLKVNVTSLSNPTASTVTVNGLFDITAGTYTIGTNNNLELRDGLAGSSAIIGSTTGNLSVTGTGAGITLPVITDGLNNFTVNRANGVTLSAGLPLTGNLDLTNGLLTTGANTVTVAGSVLNASASSYVNGRLARIFNATGPKAFAIGKGGNYRPVTLDYTSLTGTSAVTAEQFESPLPGTPPDFVSLFGDRYWSLTETGSTDRTYKLTLDGTGFSPTYLVRMIKGDGLTNTAYGVTTPDYTNAVDFNSFSNFGLGESIVTAVTPDDKEACLGSTSVDLTATVSPNPGGGTIQFYVDGNPVGTPVAVNAGTGIATVAFDPSALATGGYAIRADFSGYGTYLPSSSDPGNNKTLTINPLPGNNLAVGGEANICSGSSTDITVDLSVAGVEYQLRNDADDTPVGSPVAGDGGTIILPTGPLSETTTFNVLATTVATGCMAELTDKVTITVGGPVSDILLPHICQGTATVDIPVTVTDFSNVGSLSLTFGYTGSDLANPVVISRNEAFEGKWDPFEMTTSPAGIFRVSGFGQLPEDGITLTDNDTIFTLRFDVLANTSPATLSVSFVEHVQGTGCEYTGVAPDYVPFCDTPTDQFYFPGGVVINPDGWVDDPDDQVVCNGDYTDKVIFTSGVKFGAMTYTWTNDNTAIGLDAEGTGDIESFQAFNGGTSPVVATITVTPYYNNGGVACSGPTESFTITVLPTGQVDDPEDVTACDGDWTNVVFTTVNSGGDTYYTWTNTNDEIGIDAEGSGDLHFSAANPYNYPIYGEVTVTPHFEFDDVTCDGPSQTFFITVSPNGQVNEVDYQFLCNGEDSEDIFFETLNTGGTTTYTWVNDNPDIGLAASGTGDILSFQATNTGNDLSYAIITVTPWFLPDPYGPKMPELGCPGPTETFRIYVAPTAQVNDPDDQVVCNEEYTMAIEFTTNNLYGYTEYYWENDTPAIGLAGSGTGDIDSFEAYNYGTEPVTATITVTPVLYTGGKDQFDGCTGPPVTFTITVNPTGQVNDPEDQVVCNGDNTSVIFGTVNTGGTTTYHWENGNTEIGLPTRGDGDISFIATNTTYGPISASILVTPTFENGGRFCMGPAESFLITVKPSGHVNDPADQVVCNKEYTAEVVFTTNNTGGATEYSWTNDTPEIGLDPSGTGNVPSFEATNTTNAPIIATITVTPYFTRIFEKKIEPDCAGNPETFTITVNPTGQVNNPGTKVFCNEDHAIVSFTTENSPGVTSYTWENSNTGIGLGASGTGDILDFTATNAGTSPVEGVITVTPHFEFDGKVCDGPAEIFSIWINPTGEAYDMPDLVLCNGEDLPDQILFETHNTGGTTTYTWTNDAPGIGLGANGTGNIEVFTVINTGTAPVIATITYTPHFENLGVTCDGPSKEFTITVNPTGQVNQPATQVICKNGYTAEIDFGTVNTGGITTYEWTNTEPGIGLASSGTGDIIASFMGQNGGTAPLVGIITVTPVFTNDGVSCPGPVKEFTITVNPLGQVDQPTNRYYCNGEDTPVIEFSTANTGGTTTYAWTNDNPAIGLAGSGTGAIPTFTAINAGTSLISATITITPTFERKSVSCPGDPVFFTITIVPTPDAIAAPSSQVICSGSAITTIENTSSVPGTILNWTRDNTQITGIPSSGTGDISGMLTNTGDAPVTVTFTVTPQVTLEADLINETFTTVDPLPSGWASQNLSQPLGILSWFQGNTDVFNAHTPPGYIGVNYNSGSGLSTISNWLFLPPTRLNNGDHLYFYTRGANQEYPDRLQVRMNTSNAGTDVGTTSTSVGDFTTLLLDINHNYSNTGYPVVWTQYTITIAGLPAEGVDGRLAFRYFVEDGGPWGDNSNYIGIDDVVYHTTYVSCPGPATTATVTVNPIPDASVAPAEQTICSGSDIEPIVPEGSVEGTVFNWTRDKMGTVTGIDETGSGTISGSLTNPTSAPVTVTFTITPEFTNEGETCTGDPVTATVTVNPTAQVNDPVNQIVCNGAPTGAVTFGTINSGGTTTYTWTNDTPGIGLDASGTGNIASFPAINNGTSPVIATITVTPHFENAGETCDGPPQTFTIKVKPSGQVNPTNDVVVCDGGSVNVVFGTVNTGYLTFYEWTNDTPSIGLAASGSGDLHFTATNGGTSPVIATIVVTPYYGMQEPVRGPGIVICPGPSETFTITVNPTGQVDQPGNQVVDNGSSTTAVIFSTVNTVGTTTYAWTNDDPGIGLAASGTGDIDAFTAINMGIIPVVATIVVTPTFTYDGVSCEGPSKTFTITVNPKPLLVTHNQSACSPNKVDLTVPGVTAGSHLPPGTILSYWLNAGATNPVPDPAHVGNGTYWIKATLMPGGYYDIKPVVVSIYPLPMVYSGVGSGSYCANQLHTVGLSGSQVGVDYTIWFGLTQISTTPIHGTGGPISFDPFYPVTGFYWVLAVNTTTNCTNRMYNCIHLDAIPPLAVSVSIATPLTTVPADQDVTFTATPVNGGTTPSYQWKVNGFNAGTDSPTFTYKPVNGDEVTCVLTSSESCNSGSATSNSIVMTVTGVPVEDITVTGIAGDGQEKCYNTLKTITVAGGGTTYIVEAGGSVTMIAGERIDYLPGTHVKPGGYLHGYISTTDHCGTKAPAVVATSTGATLPEAIGNTAFTLYPNPTTGDFTIEQTSGSLYETVRVEIYGMRGDKVFSGRMTREFKHEFSIQGFPAGLYFVNLIAGDQVVTVKVIKTN